MHHRRLASSMAIIALVALSASAHAQQSIEKLLADYKKPAQTTPNDELRIAEMRDGKYLLTKPTDADRAVLKAKAEMLINRVTWPEYHTMVSEGSELKLPNNRKTMNDLFSELKQWMHTPEKFEQLKAKPNVSQLDYVREMGAALDRAILAVLNDKSPPPLLRIAAMRMLVAASETGAPAHWLTVNKMLNDPKTKPEILIYAIRAAEMLLASYDPTRVGWIGVNAAADEKIVVEVVQALDNIVLKGPPILDQVYLGGDGEAKLVNDPKKPKAGAALAPEQLAVLQLYRYQALKALSRLNLEIVGGKWGAEARPAYTFARIAIGDPAIQPAPTTKEIGEAVAGLANIVPAKQINADEMLFALATGLRAFAIPKTNNPDDNTAAWKGYSARMQLGFTALRDGVQRSSIPPANVKKAAADLLKAADEALFTPILKPALNKPNTQALDNWIQANPPAPANAHEFYSDKKGFVLKYPGGK